MPSSIKTRRVLPDDVPHLLRLWQEQHDIQAQLDPYLGQFAANRQPYIESQLLRAINGTDSSIALVAVSDGACVGFVLAHWGKPEAAEGVCTIDAIAVDAHQGQGGVGTALLNALRDRARESGMRAVQVTVPRNHAVQQAFWRAKGARVLQEIMVLDLGPDS